MPKKVSEILGPLKRQMERVSKKESISEIDSKTFAVSLLDQKEVSKRMANFTQLLTSKDRVKYGFEDN